MPAHECMSEVTLAVASIMLLGGWPAHARASHSPGTHPTPAEEHLVIAPPAQKAAVHRNLNALRKRRLHLRRSWYLQVLKGRPPSWLMNTDATRKTFDKLPHSHQEARITLDSTPQGVSSQLLEAISNSTQAPGHSAARKVGEGKVQQADTSQQLQRGRQQQQQQQQRRRQLQVAPSISQQPRLRLFEGTHVISGAGSPSLRYAFIPKVASCTRWRPRLAHRLLPKFLPSLDGPCTAFLLRHLVKLQPAEHRALHNLIHATRPRASGWLHMRLYLQQPLQGPGVWPSAEFFSLQRAQDSEPQKAAGLQTVVQTFSHRSDAVSRRSQKMRAVRAECTERLQFERLVRSVCMVSIRKLHMFSGSKLAACVAAVGDMHMRLPAPFWRRWEAATLSALPGLSSLNLRQVSEENTTLDMLMPANGGQEAGGTQVVKGASSNAAQSVTRPVHLAGHAGPGTTAVQVRAMKAGQLCSLAAGMGRCRYVPSHAWQSAFYTALQQALQDQTLQVSQLGLLLEGWALLCMETRQRLLQRGKLPTRKSVASKQGEAKQVTGRVKQRVAKGHAWAAPADLLKEICIHLQAQVQAEPRSAAISPRFITAALLACAAQAKLQAYCQPHSQRLGAARPAAPDMQWMLDFASWWLTISHQWLHTSNTKLSGAQVAAALWALGVLVNTCTTQGRSTKPPLQAHARIGVATALLTAAAAGPSTKGTLPAAQLAATAQTVPTVSSVSMASAAAHVVAAAHRWAYRAAGLQMRSTTARTAHLVYATLVGMHHLQCAPKPDIVQQCVAAVADSLPELTTVQVLDCITVLAAWSARPGPDWAASLSVWLLLHAHHLKSVQLLLLLEALRSMHILLPPACALHVLQLLQNCQQTTGLHQAKHIRV